MDYVIKGAKATPFTFTWQKKDGSAYDLTGYTTIETVFVLPDGSTVTKSASLVGLATAGVTQSVVDFTSGAAGTSVGNTTGPWKAIGHFVKAADEKYTLPIEFYVLDVGEVP